MNGNSTSSKVKALVGGIYTLTPTHCGTGQTTGAVDLPIAREMHSRLPVIPATSLKGVARDRLKLTDTDEDKRKDKDLFGPKNVGKEGLSAGELVFLEGQLLAFPVRCLSRPFAYVTSPLLLERYDRALRAFGLQNYLPANWTMVHELLQSNEALVPDMSLAQGALVLEDLVFQNLAAPEIVKRIAEHLCVLLPHDGAETTRARLQDSLVIVADGELTDLVERTTPVQARIRLTEGKTTSPFLRADGSIDSSGNLWYEESLPPDCLFFSLISARGRLVSRDPLRDFSQLVDRLQHAQIGGNETVGQGYCWWTANAPSYDTSSSNQKGGRS